MEYNNIGLLVFRPRVSLPWKLTRNEIAEIFAMSDLTLVTKDYYVVSVCVFEESFCCNMGFHLMDDKVYKLEFFRPPEYFKNGTIKDSYAGFQEILVGFFGLPKKVSKWKCIWKFNDFEVVHDLFERFDLEEHVEIHFGS